MSPDERWQQLERLFLEASELAPADQDSFLSSHCDTDKQMRDELAAMLASDDLDSGDFVGSIVQREAFRVTAATPHSRRRIGPYRVARNLGSGGMGAVYLAVRDDDHYSKEVAVKMLRTGLADEAAHTARFRTERQILAGLEHPNIARLLDGGTSEAGEPYLVMEYVPGQTITDYCSSHNLSNSAKVALFCQVCDAVNYAHQKLIIHRDLKPANILVTYGGVPKLLDFGIAKLLDPASEDMLRTITGFYMMMTPDYASPEQVRGERVTTSTDVYALGAVLYQLLSGQKPHGLKNYDPAELTREICETDVRPPSAMGHPGLRGDLDTIVLKAMQREPVRRYRSVEQFSEDLRRWLRGDAVSARPDTFTYRASKYARRHRIGLVALGAVVLALAAGTWVAWRQAQQAQARFAQVRKLANRFVFEFHDEIEKLPGSVRAHQMLVSTALEYLDNLALHSEGDPGLAAELASAYDRIGDVQGNPLSANLGAPQEAMKNYRKALTIGERLTNVKNPDANALQTLAKGYLKIATMLWQQGEMREAKLHLQRSLRIANQVTEQHGDPLWLLKTRIRLSLSLSINYSGALQEALPEARQMLQHTQAWHKATGDTAARYWISIAHIRLSNNLGELGQMSESTGNMQKGLAELRQLTLEFPHEVNYFRDLGNVKGHYGKYLSHPGNLNIDHPKEAIPLFEEMLKSDESIAAKDPNDIRAKLDVLSSMLILALAESEVNSAKATLHLSQAEQILLSIPAEAEYLTGFNRTIVLRGVGWGRIAERAGMYREAERQYLASCAAQRQLVRKYPEAGLLIYPWLSSLVRLARVQSALGEMSQAEATLNEALREALVSPHPDEVPILAARSDIHEALGAMAAKAKRSTDARIAYQNSLNLWQNKRDTEYGAKRWAQATELLANIAR